MNIIINTDHHIKGSESFKERLTAKVEMSLKRYDEFFTRAEIFLTDENRGKTSPMDKKCVLEIRLKRRDPLAVSFQADTIDVAIEGALAKVQNLLQKEIGKLQSH